jgi:hypothetical protein
MRKNEGAPYVKPERLDRNLRIAARAVPEGGLPLDEASALAGLAPDELAEPAPMKPKHKRQNLRKMIEPLGLALTVNL